MKDIVKAVWRGFTKFAAAVAILAFAVGNSAYGQECCVTFPAGTTLHGAVTVYPNWTVPKGNPPTYGYTTPSAWFAVKVSDPNAPISEGIYPAWCVDESHFLPARFKTIPGSNYVGYVISTCDPIELAQLPTHGGTPPMGPPPVVTLETWHEVNYILNHKAGYYWWNVQVAINRLVGGPAPNDPIDPDPASGYPPVDTSEVDAILADAAANAGSWTLLCGDIVGVLLVIPDPVVQPPHSDPLYQILVLEVPCSCMTLTCPASCGNVFAPYSSSLVAGDGTPPYTYSIIAGGLPPGLTLDANSGLISGTPVTAGAFAFTAKAVDSTSPTYQTKIVSCSIAIYDAVTLTCPSGSGEAGVPYSSALVAGGGSGSYNYWVSVGSLPDGLTLDATTGAITGTPTNAGTFNYTASVKDDSDCGEAHEPCQITITDCKLGDFVWVDENANGAQDAGEPGIPGVLVTLFNCDDTPAGRTVTTDANGKYLFSNLAPGSYYVVFSGLPAGFIFTAKLNPDGSPAADDSNADPATGKSDCRTLVSGQYDDTVDAGAYQPASLGDFVWEDRNANGAQDAGEPGVAGATVTLTDCSGNAVTDLDGNPVGSITTPASGFYQFANLKPGQYQVTVTLPSGYVFTTKLNADGSPAADDSNITPATGMSDCRTLVSGQYDDTVDAGLVPEITIGDRVWNDLNGNGVQDGGEPGVPGVTVQLLDCSDAVVQTTTTDAGGLYSFTVPAGGQYQVKFVNPGSYVFSPTGAGTSATDSNPNPATGIFGCATYLTSDDTIDAGLYKEPCTGSIGDRIWNDTNCDGNRNANGFQDTGEPGIPGVVVQLKDSGGNVIDVTVTGPNGIYAFSNLCAGVYAVSVTAPTGYRQTYELDGTKDGNTTVSLAAGQKRTDVDFGYVGCAPGVHLEKTGPTTATPGQKITYHFKVVNTGNTTLCGGVTVKDQMLGGTIWHKTPVLPGEVNEFDKTYCVSSCAKGVITNTATAIGCPPGSPQVTDVSVWKVTILVTTASVGDRVWNDCNGNGVQDAGEAGFAGWTVTLKNGSGAVVGTTTTDANGIYGFANLAVGTYTVVVTPAANCTQTYDLDGVKDSKATVTLTSGQNRADVDFGYKQACIAFRSAASGRTGCSLVSLSICKPAGTQAGDVMVASIAVRPSTAAITAPAGWTLVRRLDNTSGNSSSLAVYYRVAGASEPSSFTWRFSTSSGASGGIQSFSGVDTSAPIDVQAGQTTPNGLNHTAPSVTTRYANDMIVTSHALASSTRFSPPSGLAEAFDLMSDGSGGATGVTVEGNYGLQPAVSATGAKTATASGYADTGNAHTLALKSK